MDSALLLIAEISAADHYAPLTVVNKYATLSRQFNAAVQPYLRRDRAVYDKWSAPFYHALQYRDVPRYEWANTRTVAFPLAEFRWTGRGVTLCSISELVFGPDYFGDGERVLGIMGVYFYVASGDIRLGCDYNVAESDTRVMTLAEDKCYDVTGRPLLQYIDASTQPGVITPATEISTDHDPILVKMRYPTVQRPIILRSSEHADEYRLDISKVSPVHISGNEVVLITPMPLQQLTSVITHIVLCFGMQA